MQQVLRNNHFHRFAVIPAARTAAGRRVVVDARGGTDEDLAARGNITLRADDHGLAQELVESGTRVFELARPAFVAGAVAHARRIADEQLDVGHVEELVLPAAHRLDLLAEDRVGNAARHADLGRNLTVADHRIVHELDVEERLDLEADSFSRSAFAIVRAICDTSSVCVRRVR